MGQIYKIENEVNGKIYVGSSKDGRKRYLKHLSTLRKSRHHNIHLQRAFDKYGEDVFSYSVIEETEDLFERELFWIKSLDPDYNIGGVCGGDTYTNHPDQAELKVRLTEQLRNCKKPDPRYGADNPNWRGGSSVSYCECGANKARKAKSCGGCRDRTGEGNSFYGKAHSDETKKAIGEANSGRVNESQCRKVICDGVEYPSLAEAARVFGVTVGAIIYRVKKEKFNFHYI